MHLFIFEDMLHKRYKSVKNIDNAELVFEEENTGRIFKFYHDQDCCETVELVDVVGDLSDLEGVDLLEAEEISSNGPKPTGYDPEDYIWTFYRFSTIKGSVTVRWAGGLPSYYSLSVDFSDSEYKYPWDQSKYKTFIEYSNYKG